MTGVVNPKWGEERGVGSQDVVTEVNNVKEDQNFGEGHKLILGGK